VPPLAERPDDVLPLARAILARLPKPAGATGWSLAPEAEAALLRHDWPGNVRELENTLRRAVVFAAAPTLAVGDLGLPEGAARGGRAGERLPGAALGDAGSAAVAGGAVGAGGGAGAASPDPERIALERALDEAGGVVARAAERLGMSRQALYRRLEKHGLAVRRRIEDG
jgi:DNA-binding NtrC family response regulator